MKIILVFGPTASGKSSFAEELSQHIDSKIINADSMQLYKDIPILSAQPHNPEQYQLYSFLESDANFSVANWIEKVIEEIEDTRKQGKYPILVGGTGLYFKSLIDGFKDLPETLESQKQEVEKLIEEKSLDFLYDAIITADKDAINIVRENDKQRIIRYYILLNYYKILPSKIKDFPNRKFFDEAEFFKIYINPQREKLYEKINSRVDEMLGSGAIDEVKKIKDKSLSKTIMQAIGIKEISGYLDGDIFLEEAAEAMKKNTRRYAKRQNTWFNHQIKKDIIFDNLEDIDFSSLVNKIKGA